VVGLLVAELRNRLVAASLPAFLWRKEGRIAGMTQWQVSYCNYFCFCFVRWCEVGGGGKWELVDQESRAGRQAEAT
jgi:hypothetical protein